MNCDPIARWYRWVEYFGFGRELERRRFAFLEKVADARRILVLGDGDGRFLKRLVDQNLEAKIDYVDSSKVMLDLARRRSGERVKYHCRDARSMPFPRGEYDLIVTHFFLDCFNTSDAEDLAHRVTCATAPNARWLVSEFRRTAWAWLGLRVLYLFFRITTGLRTTELVDHHPLLVRAGFQLERSESSRFGLLSSELWSRVRQ